MFGLLSDLSLLNRQHVMRSPLDNLRFLCENNKWAKLSELATKTSTPTRYKIVIFAFFETHAPTRLPHDLQLRSLNGQFINAKDDFDRYMRLQKEGLLNCEKAGLSDFYQAHQTCVKFNELECANTIRDYVLKHWVSLQEKLESVHPKIVDNYCIVFLTGYQKVVPSFTTSPGSATLGATPSPRTSAAIMLAAPALTSPTTPTPIPVSPMTPLIRHEGLSPSVYAFKLRSFFTNDPRLTLAVPRENDTPSQEISESMGSDFEEKKTPSLN